MTLLERVSADLTAAMKAKDAGRLSALRMAKAALMNREIDSKGGLKDADAEQVLRTLVKQREDSIAQFKGAGRGELADREAAEIDVLREYLPQGASEAEIAAAVEEAVSSTGAASAKDLGKAMKAALALLAERGKPADGKKVNEAIRKRLGA